MQLDHRKQYKQIVTLTKTIQMITYKLCITHNMTIHYIYKLQGGAHPAFPPPPPKIGKNMIFCRRIVILHTKYPKNVRASLRSVQFF
jgi:hypothetical protein